MRAMSFLVLAACATLSAAAPAHTAGNSCGPHLTVTFEEAAPKDRFVILNDGAPGWAITDVRIVLVGSRGRLLFDTEAGGPGLNVYQPFELATPGADVRVAEVEDGSEALSLSFNPGRALQSGARVAFTIDVDDRVQLADMGPTMISGNEIEGARVIANAASAGGQSTTLEAMFDRTGTAQSPALACS